MRTVQDQKRQGDWPPLLLAIGQPVETLDEFARLLEGLGASGSTAEMSAREGDHEFLLPFQPLADAGIREFCWRYLEWLSALSVELPSDASPSLI